MHIIPQVEETCQEPKSSLLLQEARAAEAILSQDTGINMLSKSPGEITASDLFQSDQKWSFEDKPASSLFTNTTNHYSNLFLFSVLKALDHWVPHLKTCFRKLSSDSSMSQFEPVSQWVMLQVAHSPYFIPGKSSLIL